MNQVSSRNFTSSLVSRILASVFLTSLICVVLLEIYASRFQNQRMVAFWIEFIRDDGLASWLTIAALVLAAPFSIFLSKWDLPKLGQKIDKNVALICLGSLAFCGWLMTYMAFRHPFVADEYLALLGAKVFAAGQLKAHVPPHLIDAVIPRYAKGDHITVAMKAGDFVPTYWPGYAVLMAPFTLVNLAWLFNSILTACSLFVLYRVANQLIGGRGGSYALIFALASPVIALNAATYFSMPAHLLANLLFCWAFIQEKRRYAFLAGIIGSYALCLHNPVPHLTFALPWVIWACIYRRSHLLPLVIGYCLIAFPVSILWGLHLGSFDAGRYIAQTKSASPPFEEIISRVAFVFRLPSNDVLQLRLAGLLKLILWASPGLAVLAWYGWRDLATRRKIEEKSDKNTTYLWLLGASVVTNFLFYFLVRFDQGHGWGYRYMHQTWFALPILGAYALNKISSETRVFKLPVKTYFLTLAVFSVTLLLPLRIIQGQIIMQNVLNEGTTTVPAPVGIIFYQETGGGLRDSLIQNDPFLRSDVWRFRSQGRKINEALAQRELKNPRLIDSGKWGEVWAGDSFNSPARS